MIKRKHYGQTNANFAAALKTADSRFLPRFHLFYTEREAEQDAVYWFMKGQQSQLLESLSIVERHRDSGERPPCAT